MSTAPRAVVAPRRGEVAQRPERLLGPITPALIELRPGGAHGAHQHPHERRSPALHVTYAPRTPPALTRWLRGAAALGAAPPPLRGFTIILPSGGGL